MFKSDQMWSSNMWSMGVMDILGDSSRIKPRNLSMPASETGKDVRVVK